MTGRESAGRSLEGLPFEVQRLILGKAPSLDELRTLIRASPQLYRVYVEDRPRILRAFISNLLEDIILDAHAAYVSGEDIFQSNRGHAMLWEFLDDFRQRRDFEAPAALAARLSEKQLIGMIRYHASVIEPLTDRYTAWVTATLASPPQELKYELEEWPLTSIRDMDRRRIQRAFYHFQLFCNVSGRRVSHSSGRSSCIHDPSECWRVLTIFPEYQFEAIRCVHTFARVKYRSVHENPWLYSLENSIDAHYDPFYRQRFKSVMLGEGLDLLLAMFQTEDQDSPEVASILCSKLEASAHEYPDASGHGDFILEAVEEPMQMRRADGSTEIIGWRARRLVERNPLEREALDSPPFHPLPLLYFPGYPRLQTLHQSLHQSLR